MKRRDFIKSFTALSVAGTKMPLMAFSRSNKSRKPSGDWNPDRIVLLIKLNGGNDGLNTLIPIQDSIYYNLRPNLGIKSSNSLSLKYDTRSCFNCIVGLDNVPLTPVNVLIVSSV